MRRLLAATLSVSSLWQLMPPTAAAQVATPLTAAGTTIDNTATGTYIDPNNPLVPINTTSNQVTATVAEVAGVTVVSSGTIDVNGGSVTTGDFVDYSFLITNTGNDRTALHIPTSATITPGTGTLGTTTRPAVAGRSVYVTEINGVVLTSPVLLPVSGNTNDPLFITAVNGLASGVLLPPVGDALGGGSIPIGGTIKVIVPVTIAATSAGTLIPVTLGNTGTYVGDVGTNTQNQPDAGNPTAIPPTPVETGADLGGADEVYTINVTTDGRATAPANGVREASAKNTQVLATQINNLALATVLKKRIGYAANSAATFADDTLTYRLDLNVETSPPAGSTGITPATSLLGTAITTETSAGVGTVTTNKVLISDVIPTDTTLALGAALPPATVTINCVTWTRVYSTQAKTVSALAATQRWLLDTPVAGTTRIGYIADGPIASGYSTTGASDAAALRVQVVTSLLGTTIAAPVTIANIAQVFGQTTAGPISPTNPLVYDESGDQNPNNYESGSPSVAAITDPTFATTPVPTGEAVPATDGTDTNGVGNNNTGTGPGGEDNVFTINPLGSILNGPPGQAGAIGPNGNNTDFVNKSAGIPESIAPDAPITTATLAQRTVVFTNTVQNPATNTAQLDNVTLEPITAAQAASATTLPADPNFQLPTASNGEALIVGTTVTIAYPVGSVPGVSGNTATYTLSATGFDLTQSTIGAAISPAATAKPVRITSIAIGDPQDYNVTVVLPNTAIVTRAYSVPIVAYVDSNVSNSGALTGPGPFTKGGFKSIDSDAPFNIKIDRVYTGYLDLRKQSRVLQGTGPAVVAADVAFSAAAKTPAPGNILEYLLTYTNISTPASGSANVILNANNIVITEDGATLPNNWATTTLNVPSTATVAQNAAGAPTATFSAVITFFNGTTAVTTVDPNVTRYLNSIPTLTPGQTGFFRFQRTVK